MGLYYIHASTYPYIPEGGQKMHPTIRFFSDEIPPSWIVVDGEGAKSFNLDRSDISKIKATLYLLTLESFVQ